MWLSRESDCRARYNYGPAGRQCPANPVMSLDDEAEGKEVESAYLLLAVTRRSLLP